MRINSKLMKSDERATFELRALYQQYGYTQFKMGKFEEYELYVRNKDFIASDSIITFNDAGGKLMALKPDLTLSIVKNYHHVPDMLRKFTTVRIFIVHQRVSIRTRRSCRRDSSAWATSTSTIFAKSRYWQLRALPPSAATTCWKSPIWA